MTTALVTGATSGIGFAFAKAFAQRGYHLVIVSRDTERMNGIAEAFREGYDITVEVITSDLSTTDGIERAAERAGSLTNPVDIVVNNAGYGLKQSILDASVDTQLDMHAVLTRAVLQISHAAGRAMRERGTGCIINVSSVAAFTAIGTYAAAKAWVTTFSEALAVELKPHGVHVMSLNPGFVKTEFHQRSGLSMDGAPGAVWLDADDLVAAALRDARARKVVSVPSVMYKSLVTFTRHAPRSLVRRLSGNVRDARDT